MEKISQLLTKVIVFGLGVQTFTVNVGSYRLQIIDSEIFMAFGDFSDFSTNAIPKPILAGCQWFCI
jgi:hypothetical protein